MKVKVLGKPECAPCKSTKHKVQNLIKKNKWEEAVAFEFVDVETEEGEVQREFYEMDQIPCLVVEDDDGDIVHQSEKDDVPNSDEIKKIIKEVLGD